MFLKGSWILYFFILFMNILHVVSTRREIPAKVKKLKAACKDPASCTETFSKEELKQRLTPLEYQVTQEKGTEKPFSGKYVDWKQEGVFNCVVCGNPLFSSDSKYDSRSGWPSFSDVLDKEQVMLKEDTSHGMPRMELKCGGCTSHLGHVFDDGPKPSGIRYCVNSASLDFRKHTTV